MTGCGGGATPTYERMMLPLPSTEVEKVPEEISLVPAMALKFELPELVAGPLSEMIFQVWFVCQNAFVELGTVAEPMN